MATRSKGRSGPGKRARRGSERARQGEARFRGLTDLSSDWYWEQDEQFRFTFLSSRFSEKTGLDASAHLGSRRWDRPAANLGPADWERHRAMLDRHEPFRDFEMRRVRPDGSSVWLSISGEPVFDARGRFRGYRGVGRDITERKRADEALRESEARFRSLTHLSSDWYWELDKEYRITRLEGRNVAGGDVTLMQRLIGLKRWESGLDVEGGWEAHIAMLDARKRFLDVLMWRRRSDGALRFLRVSGEPVLAADGTFTGYRGVGRDVTLPKREEQILRLEHQVALVLSEAENEASGIRAVLHSVCESEGWASGQYFAFDEAAGLLRFREAWAIPEPTFDRFIEGCRGLAFQPGYGISGKALQTGETVWTTDGPNDPRVFTKQLWADAGVRGCLAFPVVSQARRIGVLAFVSPIMREPDKRLLQATRIIGGQVGQFLQRKRAEDALRESESRFRSLTQMSSDFFWETDEQHRFTLLVHGPNYKAKFATAIIGKTSWELPYTTPDEAGWDRLRATLDAREAFREFEFGRPRAEGGASYFSVSGEPHFAADGRFLGYRGIGRDITELVLARQHVASLAYSDPLTGLANRTSLGPAFEQAVERARRRSARLASLFIDLDGFKQINDVYGHQAGDRFLVETGRRLRASVRASDLVARLGGDEFFAVLEDVQEVETVETVARKLLAEIQRPVELPPGVQVCASASIGISIFPDDAQDAGSMMRHADRAMYQAKQAGKNDFRFYADSQAILVPPPSRSEAA
jgi:diguanylate cyclase (GGDEF)-like protein/PAS domain S-box-containing protein